MSEADLAKSALDLGVLELSRIEVKQLWWFLDGAIMNVDTRHHLWRSWGLCPRHAWGYAVIEIEVRGGVPFSTAILYEDLTRRAGQTLGRRLLSQARVRTQLEPHDSCFTCDFLKGGASDERKAGEPQWGALTARINRRSRTSTVVAASEQEWCPRSCPLCLGGQGPVCRAHIVAGASQGDALADKLEDLAARLDAFARSLTVEGRQVGPPERSSWIEALGWFGGWDFARKLADDGRVK
jgi:hypothetical protein